jgi:hypothetical protein
LKWFNFTRADRISKGYDANKKENRFKIHSNTLYIRKMEKENEKREYAPYNLTCY